MSSSQSTVIGVPQIQLDSFIAEIMTLDLPLNKRMVLQLGIQMVKDWMGEEDGDPVCEQFCKTLNVYPLTDAHLS